MSEQDPGNDLRGIEERLSSSEEETRRLAVLALSRFPLQAGREYLFTAMGDSSWRVRKEAVEVVLSSPSVLEYAEEIFSLLRSHENAGLRNSASEALVRMGKAVLPILENHGDDADNDVRKFVVDIMGAIGDASSFPRLIRALQDNDPNVRTSAVESLGRMKDSRAVQPLLDALSRSDVSLRYTILDALAAIGAPFPLETITPFLADVLLRKAVYECLGSVAGIEAVPLLMEGLADGGKSVREASAKALASLRARISGAPSVGEWDSLVREGARPRVVDTLLSLVEGSDSELQRAAVTLLGSIGDGSAAPAILRACRNERLFPECLLALRAIGSVTVSLLEREFSNGDEETKRSVLRICGEMMFRDSLELARKGMRDPSPMVREAAAATVGKIGLSELVPDVSALLNDLDPDVRDTALTTLALLSGTDTEAVTGVAGALAISDDPEKRRYAAFLCGVLHDEARLALLLKDEDARVRKGAVQGLSQLAGGDAVHYLILALTDEDPDVRSAAATTLGESHRKEAVDALALAARDTDPWVRCAALRSLGRVGGSRALPEIEAALDSSDGLLSLAALEALAGIEGETSLNLIRRATEGEDGNVVKFAMEILEQRRDLWIVEQGEALLRHPHWDVRNTAVRILAERRGSTVVPLLERTLETENDELVRNRIVEVLKRFS